MAVTEERRLLVVGKYKNFMLHLKVNHFIGSKIVTLPNDVTNKLEEGIFIPFEPNGIERNKNGNYFARFFVNEWLLGTGYSYQTHNIVLRVPKDKMKELQELGYDKVKMGHLTLSKYQNNFITDGEKVKLEDYE